MSKLFRQKKFSNGKVELASQVKKKKQSNRSKALKAKIEENKDNFIFKYPVYIRVKEFKTNIDVYFCHSYASWKKVELKTLMD